MSEPAPLDEPKASALTIAYRPCDETVWENPPRFTWLPALDETQPSIVQIAPNPAFTAPDTIEYAPVYRSYFTPPAPLAPGRWWWRYAVCSKEAAAPASQWSPRRAFVVPDGLPATPLPSPQARLARAAQSRPRLWLGADAAAAFTAALATNRTHCGFDRFFERAVKPFVDKPIGREPARYPGDVKVATQWRQIYIDCQEMLYGVRHLAIAGRF